jgi:hypothetical protein
MENVLNHERGKGSQSKNGHALLSIGCICKSVLHVSLLHRMTIGGTPSGVSVGREKRAIPAEQRLVPRWKYVCGNTVIVYKKSTVYWS